MRTKQYAGRGSLECPRGRGFKPSPVALKLLIGPKSKKEGVVQATSDVGHARRGRTLIDRMNDGLGLAMNGGSFTPLQPIDKNGAIGSVIDVRAFLSMPAPTTLSASTT